MVAATYGAAICTVRFFELTRWIDLINSGFGRSLVAVAHFLFAIGFFVACCHLLPFIGSIFLLYHTLQVFSILGQRARKLNKSYIGTKTKPLLYNLYLDD